MQLDGPVARSADGADEPTRQTPGRRLPDAGRPSPALGRYEPGIDGLRVAAVAAVLAYHADLPWAQGGFLGVSLFFTLSGFLITSILLRRHVGPDAEPLGRFWAHRFRRLLPAAGLALAGVLVFGATVGTEQQVRDLPGGVAAAVAQVANWFFVLTGRSYAEQFTAPSPVAHFWSLAVEEQFYLAMPLVLLGLVRLTRSPLVVSLLLAAMALASTAATVLLFRSGASIDRLYFGTDTRAAELLVGCVLAVLLDARPLRLGAWAHRVVGVAGTAAFAATVWAWSSLSLGHSVLYRGGLLVVALTSAVLITSVVAGAGPVSTALSWRPVAALGRITYGVYLFHWPVYLWLDADRTGLDPAPLLALRLVVTLAAATVSYHLVEMPVRNGSWRLAAPRLGWAVAPAAVVLVAGALAVGQRQVDSDLAGLGEPVSAVRPVPPEVPEPAVVTGVDDVLDVVVIADGPGAGMAAALEVGAATADDLTVTVVPWSCAGVDPAGAGPGCTDWASGWPAVVAAADPDVVLVHVDTWDVAAAAGAAGVLDPAAHGAWALEALGAGADLLTTGGATVVWAHTPTDIESARRAADDPFRRAVRRLAAGRPDVRVLDTTHTGPMALVADIRPYRRRGPYELPRVLVVGDSVARTVGHGLERWADERGTAIVWSSGTEGCGVVDDGEVRDPAGRARPVPAHCGDLRATWAEQVGSFDPDLVIVLSTAWDLQQRRVEGWPSFLGPGDPAFDDHLVAEYAEAYDVLAAGGAHVLWMRVPCADDKVGMVRALAADALAPERVRHANEVILRRVSAARPGLRVFDLFGVLCPDGEYVDEIDGVAGVRPDGVHLSARGSRWLAGRYGPGILATGLDRTRPADGSGGMALFP